MSGDSSPPVIQHFVLLLAMASREHTWQTQVDHMLAQCWDGVDMLLMTDVRVCCAKHAIVLLTSRVMASAADRNMKCWHNAGSIAYCFFHTRRFFLRTVFCLKNIQK